MLHLLLAVTNRLYHELEKKVYQFTHAGTLDLKLSPELGEVKVKCMWSLNGNTEDRNLSSIPWYFPLK